MNRRRSAHRLLVISVFVWLAVFCLVPAGCRRGADRHRREETAARKFERTTNPDAQWFPDAGLGLFLHWGIHSVAGIQPSWAMIKDYPVGGDPRFYPPEKYYQLARQFNPQNYDPDKWMAAASKAGFTYAVLTTKHHDGYALWPSKYGDLGTRQYMNSRDLPEPYVKACRKYGLKVGFYFSFADWHHPKSPDWHAGFDYNKRNDVGNIDPVVNQRNFEEFYAYAKGQLEELLTRYGKIDVLWFDGVGWEGIKDLHTYETLAWVRSLQPGIVINNRWGGVGDFSTPEWNLPGELPSGWWEYCTSWNRHWGYSPEYFRSVSWVLSVLAKVRSSGGNFLLNCGPAPDGTMSPLFYERTAELARWMAHSRKSLIGAHPIPHPDACTVPATTQDGVWYLHLLPESEGDAIIEVRQVSKPKSVILLRTGELMKSWYEAGTLGIEVPPEKRTSLDDVVAVTWQTQPGTDRRP